MATAPIGGSPSPANPLTFTLSPGMAPAAPLMRMLARFDRAKVEAFAEISIALLDLMDPDPDLEDGGDDELTGDEQDVAWPEWRARGAQLPVGTLHRANGTPYTPNEDDEDDDPAEQDDDCLTPSYRIDQSAPIGFSDTEQLARWNSLPTGG